MLILLFLTNATALFQSLIKVCTYIFEPAAPGAGAKEKGGLGLQAHPPCRYHD